MEKKLIAVREAVMDNVDLASDSAWPDRKGDHFVDEMTKAAIKLQAIAEQMDLEGINKTEIGRTYTNLGTVYSDLVPALGSEMLNKAKEAYQKAEKYLAGCKDELIIAKFNFNYANTLRQIDPNDIELLSEAKERFEFAESCFSIHAPQFLSLVKEGLASVNSLLLLAPITNKVNSKLSQLDKMNESIEKKENVTDVFKQFQELRKEDGGISGLTGEIYGALNAIKVNPENKDKLNEIQVALNMVAGIVTEETKSNDPGLGNLFKAIKGRLKNEIEAGNVDSVRAEVLKRLIEQFESQTTSGNDSLEKLLSKVQYQREIISANFELVHYLSHGIERPPAGSIAEALVERCWLLRRFILEEMSRTGKGPEESKIALELNIKSAGVDKLIYEAGIDEDRAKSVDYDILRPLALEIQNFSSRMYPMIARPIWTAAKESVDVKEIFYSGVYAKENRLRSFISDLGYNLPDQPQGHSFAVSRWRQLLRSMTTVFDLRYAKDSDLAAITYELGIAITIGKPVVIVINEKDRLPFDIEIKPIVFTDKNADEKLLITAIDESLSWTYPKSAEKPFMATLDYVLSTYRRPLPNTYADQTFRMLQDKKKDCDPLSIDGIINKLFEYLDDGKTIVIHPVFPPAYPDPGIKRIFHVTPFRPNWATKTRDQIRKTCKRFNAEYIRGDEAKDPNVIRSIWTEIAIATHLVVDLTGFNPNVTLELGIAHTLGKQLLMVGQTRTTDNLFPMISKLRITPYDKPEDLDKIVAKFLKQ